VGGSIGNLARQGKYSRPVSITTEKIGPSLPFDSLSAAPNKFESSSRHPAQIPPILITHTYHTHTPAHIHTLILPTAQHTSPHKPHTFFITLRTHNQSKPTNQLSKLTNYHHLTTTNLHTTLPCNRSITVNPSSLSLNSPLGDPSFNPNTNHPSTPPLPHLRSPEFLASSLQNPTEHPKIPYSLNYHQTTTHVFTRYRSPFPPSNEDKSDTRPIMNKWIRA